MDLDYSFDFDLINYPIINVITIIITTIIINFLN